MGIGNCIGDDVLGSVSQGAPRVPVRWVLLPQPGHLGNDLLGAARNEEMRRHTYSWGWWAARSDEEGPAADRNSTFVLRWGGP